jgi:hypothetical protein
MLTASGWILQDYKTLNLSAAHLEEAGSRGTPQESVVCHWLQESFGIIAIFSLVIGCHVATTSSN